MSKHVLVLQRPSKAAIRSLEPFQGLPLTHIHQPRLREDFIFAWRELMSARFVGLDTETKPPFVKGEAGEGPHVIQLATRNHVFVFSIDRVLSVGALDIRSASER